MKPVEGSASASMPVQGSTEPAQFLWEVALAGTRVSTAAPVSKSTFLDALIVPDLAEACCRALEQARFMHGLGFGLKQLRLISRGVRATLQQAVQGYVLSVQHHDVVPSCISDPEQLAFINACQLRRLRIYIPTFIYAHTLHLCTAHKDSIQATATRLAAQLCAIAASAKSAFSSVTSLNITLPNIIGSEQQKATATDAITAILLPLVIFCPQLQTLSVTGQIDSSILKHFGSNCPRLASLELVFTEISRSTLQELPMLLPCLSTLTALRSPFNDDVFDSPSDKDAELKRYSDNVCVALRACTRLLNFQSGCCGVSEEIWQALPQSLTSLDASSHGLWWSMANLQTHSNLRTLVLGGITVGISPLVLLLNAAPNLGVLQVNKTVVVDVSLFRAQARDVQRLDMLLCAGLRVEDTGAACSPSNLQLFFDLSPLDRDEETEESSDEDEETETLPAVDFQHPMWMFMSADIMDKPLLSFTNVAFSHSGEEYGYPGDLSNLHRVFPNLRVLELNNLQLEQQGLQHLESCNLLRNLTLTDVEGIDRRRLESLCKNSKSLQSVHLIGCRGIMNHDWLEICRLGGKLSGVSVLVEKGEKVEEEEAAAEQEREERGWRWLRESCDTDDCDFDED